MNKIKSINELCEEELIKEKYDTGYKQLDEILGSIEVGSIVTIGARVGMGKTVFMQNIMMQILDKYKLPTLYINFESSNKSILESLSAIVSNISYREIRDNNDIFIKAKDNLKSKSNNLYIANSISVFELKEILNNNSKIKFVFIDYIQLMKLNDEHYSSTTIGEILNKLKLFAIEHNIIIFLTSQMNRSLETREDKRPTISDFSKSSNIESCSDILITLFRESYYSTSSTNSTEIIVAKNRNGAIGTTYLDYNEEYRTFKKYE